MIIDRPLWISDVQYFLWDWTKDTKDSTALMMITDTRPKSCRNGLNSSPSTENLIEFYVWQSLRLNSRPRCTWIPEPIVNAVNSIALWVLDCSFYRRILEPLCPMTKFFSECWFSSQCSVNPRKSELVLIFDRILLIFVSNIHPASKELWQEKNC